MRAAKWAAIAVILALAVAMLLPLFLTVTSSLMGRDEIRLNPGKLLPVTPTLEAYRTIGKYPAGLWFVNSLVTAALGTALKVAVSVAAAYGLGAYRFRGRRLVFAVMLVAILIPGQVTFVPRFVIARALGLFDSLAAVIVPGGFDAVATWFLVRYMASIPDDLLLMARVDGLGAGGTLRHVVVPLSAPAIAAVSAQGVVGAWTQYLWPLVVLRSPEVLTLPIGVREVMIVDEMIHKSRGLDSLGFAGAVLVMVPAAVAFLAMQRYFVDGLFAKGAGK